MNDRYYKINISPENIKNKLFKVFYTGGTYNIPPDPDPCCDEVIPAIVTNFITGETYVYSSMTQILSGGTNGVSILTGLTIPILFTETNIDLGYYSVFDGFILQKEGMGNFLFTSTIQNPYTWNIFNTSGGEVKKYLEFSEYKIDWGDNTPIQTVNDFPPNYYSHTYSVPQGETPGGNAIQNVENDFLVTMSGTSPWGINIIQKKIHVPFQLAQINNPNGTAYFIPQGNSWSGTPIEYNYLFTGDSNNNVEDHVSSNYVPIPFIITGYTKSTINDLIQYGNKSTLIGGKFSLGPVTGSSGIVGEYFGEGENGLYTAYTNNEMTYYDYKDGTTIFIVESSGITSDWLVSSAITKNEALLNIIDAPELQSNVFIERGKISGLESVERLGEVDNLGDLVRYGYKFFKILTTNNT